MPQPFAAAEPAGLLDPDWFALNWYGQSLSWLVGSQGLVPPDRGGPLPQRLAGLHGLASGHVVGLSPGLLALASLEDAVVVGGPCIGDCGRHATLEALYDTLQCLLAARGLGLPAVVYVGDREEALEQGAEAKWLRVGETCRSWIEGLAEALGVSRVRVVRTSSPAHAEALAPAVEGLDPSDDTLDAAFHLGCAPPPPQTLEARRVTCRVIGAHLPEVVARHLDRTTGTAPPEVLVTENLQQAGVIRRAAELAARRGQAVWLAAHLPAPSPSAAQRMYRAPAWDKVRATDLERVLEGGAPGLSAYSRQFFASWLTMESRQLLRAAVAAW